MFLCFLGGRGKGYSLEWGEGEESVLWGGGGAMKVVTVGVCRDSGRE